MSWFEADFLKELRAVQHEAQRQKWLVELVVAVEATYRGLLLDMNDEHVRYFCGVFICNLLC